jgi:hypothetical protein
MSNDDEKPDIEKQLRDAHDQRERLLKQLKESESIIDSIETRLAEVTKSQEARLRADDRVDNKLLDQVQNKKNTKADEAVATVSSEKSGDKKSTSQQKIPTGDNSWYEIIIDEKGNKKERLRK